MKSECQSNLKSEPIAVRKLTPNQWFVKADSMNNYSFHLPTPPRGIVLKEGCHLERSERSYHIYTKMSRFARHDMYDFLDSPSEGGGK